MMRRGRRRDRNRYRPRQVESDQRLGWHHDVDRMIGGSGPDSARACSGGGSDECALASVHHGAYHSAYYGSASGHCGGAFTLAMGETRDWRRLDPIFLALEGERVQRDA